VLVFIVGCMIGSFLNVVIHRLPLEEDIVFTPSHCPKCKKNIPWYYNIPLFGFIINLGRCFECKQSISPRYFLVELVTGLAAYFLYIQAYLFDYTFFFLFATFCIFICHFFIDLKYKILPDSLNFIFFLLVIGYVHLFLDWKTSLIGLAIGFGGTLSVTLIFYYLKGQVGLGGGDIKLFGILGLLLGPLGIVHNIFLSCFLGSLVMLTLIALKIMKRDEPIAFGPFILIVATIQIYFPDSFSRLMINYFI
jgi:leader peptidase (prepilin peptidase)/N-methyltransferase